MHAAEPIIDSSLSIEESLAGLKIPEDIRAELVLLDVQYISFDEKLHQGQLVINRALESDVREIFQKLCGMQYPIEKIIPIVAYGWDDEKSMTDNNTSAFNYRLIAGTESISNHSTGRAIDINPWINPYIIEGQRVIPEGAVYDPENPYSIKAGDRIVILFESYGWHWGSVIPGRTDWQHFAKL